MKNYKQSLTIILFSMLLFTSCAPVINYLGKRYAPTQNVDIFFDEADIKRDYTVMGRVANDGGDDDAESVQAAIVEKAKEVGADAILFIGFYSEKVTGETRTTNASVSDDEKSAYEEETKDINVRKQYSAKFLKYAK